MGLRRPSGPAAEEMAESGRAIDDGLAMRDTVETDHPDQPCPSGDEIRVVVDTEVAIGALFDDIEAGGQRACAQQDGKVLVTDGPYLETKEHIGGFWVLDVASLDDALEWGRRAAIACRAPVEVRPFFPPPERRRTDRASPRSA